MDLQGVIENYGYVAILVGTSFRYIINLIRYGKKLKMHIISLQEIILVLSALLLIAAYHVHLYGKVHRYPLTTAIGITNHAGFMINTFEQNDETVSAEAVTKVLNHGALHYTIGMRGFYLSVPLALWLFGPIWMLAGSLVLIAVLYRLDREA